jgi:serine O-acetyltransferase
LRIFYKYRLRKLGIRLGFSIPINVFGPGLSIPHIGTIIVNNNARVGANCRLHACVNIGASGGNNKAPQIGDNVYIGPSVVMFGDISIADNVTIGANATVNKSFEDSNIVIAGCPARIVKENYPCWIEFNRIQFDTNRK